MDFLEGQGQTQEATGQAREQSSKGYKKEKAANSSDPILMLQELAGGGWERDVLPASPLPRSKLPREAAPTASLCRCIPPAAPQADVQQPPRGMVSGLKSPLLTS